MKTKNVGLFVIS